MLEEQRSQHIDRFMEAERARVSVHHILQKLDVLRNEAKGTDGAENDGEVQGQLSFVSLALASARAKLKRLESLADELAVEKHQMDQRCAAYLLRFCLCKRVTCSALEVKEKSTRIDELNGLHEYTKAVIEELAMENAAMLLQLKRRQRATEEKVLACIRPYKVRNPDCRTFFF